LLQAASHAVTARKCTESGKDATLPPHPPLRTLHATFAAQGSSLSKPRCQSLRHLEDGTFTMCTCSTSHKYEHPIPAPLVIFDDLMTVPPENTPHMKARSPLHIESLKSEELLAHSLKRVILSV